MDQKEEKFSEKREAEIKEKIHEAIKKHAGLSDFDNWAVSLEVDAIWEAIREDFVC